MRTVQLLMTLDLITFNILSTNIFQLIKTQDQLVPKHCNIVIMISG